MFMKYNLRAFLLAAKKWRLLFKGNLAHTFVNVYVLCLSFHLDISNRLEIGKTRNPEIFGQKLADYAVDC